MPTTFWLQCGPFAYHLRMECGRFIRILNNSNAEDDDQIFTKNMLYIHVVRWKMGLLKPSNNILCLMAPKRSPSRGDPVQLGGVLGKTLSEVPNSAQYKAVLAIPTVIRLDDLSTTLCYNATTYSTPKLSKATDKLTGTVHYQAFSHREQQHFQVDHHLIRQL